MIGSRSPVVALLLALMGPAIAGCSCSDDTDCPGGEDSTTATSSTVPYGCEPIPWSCTSEPFEAFGCSHLPVVEDCDAGWCRIPAGCFVMGAPECEWDRAPDSEDQVPVTLTHSFVMQQHEAALAEWLAADFDNPLTGSTATCLEADCPVGNVNWYEAFAYANRLSEQHEPPLPACYALSGCTGEVGHGMVCESVSVTAATLYDCPGYRLPTDAEWEYAARAGTLTTFYSGDITANEYDSACCADTNLERIAWYCWNSGPVEGASWPELQPHRVGQKEPNGWGLYDMMGNVGEHVNDRFTGRSPSGSVTDPAGVLVDAPMRITRGGLANTQSSWSRAAVRFSWFQPDRDTRVGFRLVRTDQ